MLATWWGGPGTHCGSSGGEPTSHIGFRSASVLERKPKGVLAPTDSDPVTNHCQRHETLIRLMPAALGLGTPPHPLRQSHLKLSELFYLGIGWAE